MTFSKPLPASSSVTITELLLRSQTQRLASRSSLPPRSKESRESIIERAIATLEDGEDFDDVNIDPAHAMTFSRHLQSNSTLDLSELRLRSQSKCFTTTNSRKSLSPSRSRENLLSVLERSIADLDEQTLKIVTTSILTRLIGAVQATTHPTDSHSEQ
jgi:hypothetical protein